MPGPRPMPLELSTARLRLRQWVDSDARPLRELWAERDPRSLRLLDEQGRPTEDDLRAQIADRRAATARTGVGLFVMEDRELGEVLGYCGLTVGRASPDEPELAFELFRSFHGRGCATEAGRAVVDAAAGTGRARLWSTVRTWNTPSFRVLDKLGFTRCDRVDPDPVRGELVWLTRGLAQPDS